MNKFLKHPLKPELYKLKITIALGLYQIMYMDTPEYAAVDATVSVAGKHKALCNAILRECIRQKESVTKEPLRNIPPWLMETWVEFYGKELAEKIALASLKEAPLDLTLKEECSIPDSVLLPNGSIRITGSKKVQEIAGYAEGKWWVQGAAAAIPAKLFDDIRGKDIVDICAAPGGKTMQLSSMGANVTAIDVSAKRLQTLRDNLKRVGLHAKIICADALNWQSDELFDGVLLDAPCTGTGIISRHPDILYSRSPKDVKEMRVLQEKLLDNAINLTRQGGIIVYSTCSLQKEEGELQTERALQSGKLSLIHSERILPCYWPEFGGIDGFYIAKFKKL